MKYLNRFNEGVDYKVYLIQEDLGDELSFVGLYDKVDNFVNDYKEYLSKKLKINKTQLKHRITEGKDGEVDEIHIEHGADYFIFTFELVGTNKIYFQ